MASKKGAGTSRNGRDSNSQRLGFKAFGGELVKAGTILIRQRGTKVRPGLFVGMGRDHTLFAKAEGVVRYEGPEDRRRVRIVPLSDAVAATAIAQPPVAAKS